jgi:uncharacterized LabA/DUF88 family protein
MPRAAIFIDGGYLNKVLQHEFNDTPIDYQELAVFIAQQIHPETDILRTYYYDCLPYQSDPPTEEEARRFGSAQNFIDALSRKPRFEVRLGRLARRGPDRGGQYYYQQKMVDVLLSIDLVRLSTKGQITHAVLVAGDADFVPAIRAARDEGLSIWLFHGKRIHNDLWCIADERIKFTDDIIESIKWERG